MKASRRETNMNLRDRTPAARRVSLAIAAIAVCLVVAACGGSTAAPTSPAPANANRTAFVKCLKEHGVAPPQHAPGSAGPPAQSGPPFGSASASHRAAFEACGAPGQHFTPGAG